MAPVGEGSQAELLVIPAVPCRRLPDGRVLLDKKFATGMAAYRDLWGGPVRSLMRDDPAFASPFAADYDEIDLPFALDAIAMDAPIGPDDLIGSALVFAGGDDFRQTDVAHQCRKLGIPCVYGVEYPLDTRLRILGVEQRQAFRLAKSALWTILNEGRRRRAFRAATSIQSNGVPAHLAYGKLAEGSFMFLDTRMSAEMMALDDDVARAAAHRATDAPLRLLYTGRFDRMKGADQLVPVMAALERMGVEATLDLFGDGAVRGVMEAQRSRLAHPDRVRLHAPLDFATELVPHIKGNYDLFLCCHPQGDPSCTYLETMGCGIPIVGYGNSAFTGLLAMVEGGWKTAMRPDAVAKVIASLDRDRSEIARNASVALTFARQHSFEAVFARRIGHLKSVLERQRAG